MNFSNILSTLRKENGLTQEDLSIKIGFAKNSICAWERGRAQPNIDTLKTLSTLFGVSVGYLVGAEDDFGVVNVTVAGEDLSKEEKELIKCYRKLDFDQQRTVRIQIGALVESKA